MYSDPISLTIAGTAVSFARISTVNMTSVYRSADGTYQLKIAHSANKKERSLIELTTTKIGPNVLNPSTSQRYVSRQYLVTEEPLNGVGFTDTELADQAKALTSFISTTANLNKFLGKES